MPRAFTADERRRTDEALREAVRVAIQNGTVRRVSIAALCRHAAISKGAFYSFRHSEHIGAQRAGRVRALLVEGLVRACSPQS